MANHSSTYYWPKHVTKIQRSECKTFISLYDSAGSEITIYDDDKGVLFRAFRKVCPQAEIENL